MHNEKMIKRYFTDIINIPSPTGYTNEIMNYIKDELDKLNVLYKIGYKGAIVATINGSNEEAITFAAHVDTLGAMVRKIKENGKLDVAQIGGYMMHAVEGENCTIHTRSGKTYEGTLQTIKPSIHIHAQEARDLPRECKNYELIIDERVYTKQAVEELGIDVGDIISFDTRTKFTESGYIKSRYLDDKIAIAGILYIINYIKSNEIKLKNTVNFFISNYEEVGHGASAFIPKNTKEFIAVDMGCPGENQNSSEYDVCICSKDSNGPYDYNLTTKLVNTCKENNIGYKLDIYPNYGSDATAAIKGGLDASFALLGPGIFASHGYERTHMKSVVETIRLILSYITA